MTIAAGKLNDKVRILRATAVDDGYQETQTWSPVTTALPASVTPLSDRAVWLAAAAQTSVSHRVVVRLVPSMTIQTTDRVEFNGETYHIETVRLFPRKGYAEMTVQKVN